MRAATHNYHRNIGDIQYRPEAAARENSAKRNDERCSSTLVLEKIIKCLSSIIRTLTASARRFLFNHHPYRIQRTLIAFVLRGNSGRNRLITFEAARRIKVLALLAGMQCEPALRALPDRIGQICQQRATLRATRNRPRARHVHRPRPKRIFFFCGSRLFKLFLGATTGILISALPILPVGQTCLLQEGSLSPFVSLATRVLYSPPQQPRNRMPPLTCFTSGGCRDTLVAENCLSYFGVLPSHVQNRKSKN